MFLKIFNVNMWLLPLRFSKHNKARVKKLIAYIKSKDPDIITLQEFWQKKYIKMLEKNLKNYFFTHTAGRVRNKSGLIVLSKEKPKKYEFFAFNKNKEKGIYNKIAEKGVLAVYFKNNLVIYTTHLHHRTEGEKVKIAYEEFALIKRKIKKDKISVLCGDLNMTKAQFEKINKGFFSYAEDSHNTFSKQNPYFKKWWEKKCVGDKKIDYILVKLPKGENFESKSETIEYPVMSDHYGIYSEIKIT